MVCGWNEEANTYLYRDESGPKKVPKQPKKALAKTKLLRERDSKISNVSAQAKGR
jgi:hypothetical protein